MIRRINSQKIRIPGIGVDSISTNSTTETIIGSLSIASNTITTGDVCRIRNVFRKETANNTAFEIKLYFNTISSLVGATQLATYSAGGTESSPSLQRTFVIKSTSSIEIYSFSGATNASYFGDSTIPSSTITGLDFTSTSYFITTVRRLTIGRTNDNILLSYITFEI